MIAAGILDLGIDLDVWPWVWLVIAVAFALVELTVLAGSFVLLPFAVSAFAASLAGFYDAPIEVQWLIFVVGGGLLFVAAFRWARRIGRRDAKPPGVGADRLVGLLGTVTAPVVPTDDARRGRVRVSGEDWGAITDGTDTIDTGTRVRILSMRGTRVVVRPADPGATAGEEHT